MNGQEKRKFKRYTIDSECEVTFESKVIKGKVLDYSDGISIIIKYEPALVKGSQVDIKILGTEIELKAEAVWTEHVGFHLKAGFKRLGNLKGNLNHFRLADILIGINKNKKTGILEIKSGSVKKRIFISNGDNIFADSSDLDDRLGQLLIHRKKITHEQLRQAAERASEKGERLGKVLVSLGFLKQNDLIRSVKYQVEDIITGLFNIENGTFDFKEGSLPADESIILQVSSAKLVYKGVKKISNIALIEKMCPPLSTVFNISENPMPIFKSLTLSNSDKHILSYIDGVNSFAKILSLASSNKNETRMTIIALLSTGLIYVTGDDEAHEKLPMEILFEVPGESAADDTEAILHKNDDLKEKIDIQESPVNTGITDNNAQMNEAEIKAAIEKEVLKREKEIRSQLEEEIKAKAEEEIQRREAAAREKIEAEAAHRAEEEVKQQEQTIRGDVEAEVNARVEEEMRKREEELQARMDGERVRLEEEIKAKAEEEIQRREAAAREKIEAEAAHRAEEEVKQQEQKIREDVEAEVNARVEEEMRKREEELRKRMEEDGRAKVEEEIRQREEEIRAEAEAEVRRNVETVKAKSEDAVREGVADVRTKVEEEIKQIEKEIWEKAEEVIQKREAEARKRMEGEVLVRVEEEVKKREIELSDQAKERAMIEAQDEISRKEDEMRAVAEENVKKRVDEVKANVEKEVSERVKQIKENLEKEVRQSEEAFRIRLEEDMRERVHAELVVKVENEVMKRAEEVRRKVDEDVRKREEDIIVQMEQEVREKVDDANTQVEEAVGRRIKEVKIKMEEEVRRREEEIRRRVEENVRARVEKELMTRIDKEVKEKVEEAKEKLNEIILSGSRNAVETPADDHDDHNFIPCVEESTVRTGFTHNTQETVPTGTDGGIFIVDTDTGVKKEHMYVSDYINESVMESDRVQEDSDSVYAKVNRLLKKTRSYISAGFVLFVIIGLMYYSYGNKSSVSTTVSEGKNRLPAFNQQVLNKFLNE